MRQSPIRDAVVEYWLLQAEERLADARALAARRALLRDARPPRRRPRVWLGSVLIAVGRRLLGPVPELRAPAASGGVAPPSRERWGLRQESRSHRRNMTGLTEGAAMDSGIWEIGALGLPGLRSPWSCRSLAQHTSMPGA